MTNQPIYPHTADQASPAERAAAMRAAAQKAAAQRSAVSPSQPAGRLTMPQRLTVRVALATAATVATFFGVQALAFGNQAAQAAQPAQPASSSQAQEASAVNTDSSAGRALEQDSDAQQNTSFSFGSDDETSQFSGGQIVQAQDGTLRFIPGTTSGAWRNNSLQGQLLGSSSFGSQSSISAGQLQPRRFSHSSR